MTKGGSTFETKKVNIGEAITEITEQLILGSSTKMMHPIGLIYFFMSGQTKLASLTPYTRTTKRNCAALRRVVDEYVQTRKSG